MDASQVGNAYEHALRELATAQAENARMRIALEEIRARSEITAERMEKIFAHAKRHEDEGFTDNDVSVLLAENARLTSEVVRLREDAARLDRLELTIRDGSFASILNDIIAFCQIAYKGIGPGPALRTAIDATLPDAKP